MLGLTAALAALAAGAVVVLPVGKWLQAPLERHCPPAQPAAAGHVDGIVLLGGGPPLVPDRPLPALYRAAADLAAAHAGARLLLTGGVTAGQAPSEAAQLAAPLRAQGIAGDRLLLETRATSTYENAVFGRRLARPMAGERWLLLTFPAHMPRALGSFHGQHWPVVPYPVGLGDRTAVAVTWLGVRHNIWQLRVALNEWGGLVVYRILGRTPTLLPDCRLSPSAPAAPSAG